jgi:hypothetical protein
MSEINNIEEIKLILEPNQFIYEPKNFLGMISHNFRRDAPGIWKIRASPSFNNSYLKVGLEQNPGDLLIGTENRFHSLSGLEQNIHQVVNRLENQAENDYLLKCPTCDVRYVHVKSGKYGDFMSCSGADMLRKKRVEGVILKDLDCRGVSKSLPVILNYK